MIANKYLSKNKFNDNQFNDKHDICNCIYSFDNCMLNGMNIKIISIIDNKLK